MSNPRHDVTLQGILPAGASAALHLTFNASSLTPGNYAQTITINSNDPNNMTARLQVGCSAFSLHSNLHNAPKLLIALSLHTALEILSQGTSVSPVYLDTSDQILSALQAQGKPAILRCVLYVYRQSQTSSMQVKMLCQQVP